MPFRFIWTRKLAAAALNVWRILQIQQRHRIVGMLKIGLQVVRGTADGIA